MMLILGLGNPGKIFEKTRHNVGFRALDEFLKKGGFSDFSLTKKRLSEISMGFLNGEEIILAKPQTFMNNSGKAAKSLVNFFKNEITLEGFVVIHDDVDLSLGKIKISKGRGSAGHKGVQSIINELGSKNFIRLRVGVKPLQETKNRKKKTAKFILKKFDKTEEKILKTALKRTIEAIGIIIKDGLSRAMNVFNQ